MQFYIDNIGHLAPYGVLLLVYLLLSLQSELLKTRWFAVPALGALLLFAGFREAITPDMEQYRMLYEAFGTLSAGFIEPTFLFFCKFLNALGFDYHALFFAYSLVTLVFLYLGIKNYTNQVKLSLLFYILIPSCFLNMFVEMREVCAISIALYATSLLRSRQRKFKLTQMLAFATLSALFHYSAILYWVIFLIGYKAIRRTHSTFAYLFLIVSTLVIPTSTLTAILQTVAYPFVPAKYQAYLDMFASQDAPADPAQLLKSLIYVLLASLLVFFRAPARSKESDPTLVNLFVVGVLLLNLSRSNAVFSRIAYYFLIQQIIVLPEVLTEIRGTVKRLTTAYCLVLFYLAQFVWGLFYFSSEEGYVFLHYQNAILSALK
jgi:transmembrane protein EpsG